MSENLSEHVAENRRYWDAMADEWVSLRRASVGVRGALGRMGHPEHRVALCSPMKCMGKGRSN